MDLILDVLLPEIQSIINDYRIQHIRTKNESYTLIDDQKQGEYTVYDRDFPFLKATYLNNQLHGLSTTYYNSGQIFSVCTWQNGKPHGDNIIYDDNGQIVFIYKYVNGVKV
jgi:antitoxin component YwqK of YwqJK toxin-antitoxin module